MMTARDQILNLVEQHYREEFLPSATTPSSFIPGITPIPYAGRVFGPAEIQALLSASLDFWLTAGKYAARFESAFAEFCQQPFCSLVNSGSSANLLAISALTSPQLGGAQLKPGDEVITPAVGFPTTLNPILQNRLVPVFVDVEIPSYNPSVEALEAAISDRTRALFLPHTLGNPFHGREVQDLCRRHSLFLIEDCCDALGSSVDGSPVGSFGVLSTYSFYPAHHITMGEGGAVNTSDGLLNRVVNSFRDWGRACHCPPGYDNTCGNRFTQHHRHGLLPIGYDHKFVYDHIGYNLKATEMQAAIGLAQMSRLSEFILTRKANWQYLRSGLSDLEKFFILPEPAADSSPSWFGFALCLRPDLPFTRTALAQFLDARKVATRPLFAGNLLDHPAYSGVVCSIPAPLFNAQIIANNVLWIGVYPGLTPAMLDYVIDCVYSFTSQY